MLLAALLLVPASVLPIGAQATAQGPVPYVVGFDEIPRDVVERGVWDGYEVRSVNIALRTVTFSVEDPAGFERDAREDGNVRYAEPDDPDALVASFTPDDPRYPDQYAPEQIGAPGAWNETLGDTGVRVAIVDSGIQNDHPDLAGWVVRERDFGEDDTTAQDECGHGTHVAGIAGAGLDNGEGIAGMANVGLIDAKALTLKDDGRCTGSFSDVADAITWSVDRGADVVSLSLGGSSSSQVLDDAIAYAVEAGVVLVAAAGNSGPCDDCVHHPAAHPEVIAVGCTTSSRERCSFSSTGPEIELAGPGASILSTYPTSTYAYASGTSMSTPHVSGLAALLLALNGELDREEIRTVLQETARDLGPEGRDDDFGYGELDAAAAMREAASSFNRPPEASFTVECLSLRCTFDASDSSDPDGDGLAYTWDLDDGTTDQGREIEHTYAESGDYFVRLTVDDGEASASQIRFVSPTLEIELEAEATQSRYGSTEQPVVRVAVTGLGTQDGIPGIDVRARTYWAQGTGQDPLGLGGFYDDRLQHPPLRDGLRAAGVYQEVDGTTTQDGRAVLEIPAMVDDAGRQVHAPSTIHDVVVEVTTVVAGETYRAFTSYRVGP